MAMRLIKSRRVGKYAAKGLSDESLATKWRVDFTSSTLAIPATIAISISTPVALAVAAALHPAS